MTENPFSLTIHIDEVKDMGGDGAPRLFAEIRREGIEEGFGIRSDYYQGPHDRQIQFRELLNKVVHVLMQERWGRSQ